MSLYISNDSDVFLEGLRTAADGEYVNDATITFSVQLNGEAVDGAEDIEMSYVSGSDGNYRGTLPGTVSLTGGEQYKIIITSSSHNIYWEITRPARRRTA